MVLPRSLLGGRGQPCLRLVYSIPPESLRSYNVSPRGWIAACGGARVTGQFSAFFGFLLALARLSWKSTEFGIKLTWFEFQHLNFLVIKLCENLSTSTSPSFLFVNTGLVILTL